MPELPEGHDATKDADDFFERLKNDRLIKLYIANETVPAQILEGLLIRVSEWFEAALDSKWNHEPGVLRFPEDGVDTWKTLLFWMTHERLPQSIKWMKKNDCAVIHLIRCWCLGDKYLMPKFQDDVMYELIQCVHDEPCPPLSVIREGLETSAPDSKLRVFTVDCLAWMWKHEKVVGDDELDDFENVVAFASTFAQAVSRYHGPKTPEKMFAGPRYYVCKQSKDRNSEK